MRAEPSVEALSFSQDASARALFEQSVLGVVECGLDGRFLRVNRRWCEMIGYTAEELASLSVLDVTHPESLGASHVAMRDVRSNDIMFEKRYVRKDGSILWASVHASPVHDATGATRSTVALVLDVTQSKIDERRAIFLADLGQVLATQRDEPSVAEAAVGALGRFLGVARCTLVERPGPDEPALVRAEWTREGLEKLELVQLLERFGGDAWWRACASAEQRVDDVREDPRTRAFAAAYEAVDIRAFATQPYARDGSSNVILVVTETTPRHFSADEVLVLEHVISRVWPLVERARTEAALAAELRARRAADEEARRVTEASERERRLHATILSNVVDLVYVFDLHHRFTYANDALLAMWGTTFEQAIGKNCLELGYPDWHAAMHDREIDHVVRTRQPYRGEVPFHGTNGERIYDYIFVPVIGADGEVEAVAGSTRDVTDRKRAEALLAGQAETLELVLAGAPLDAVFDALRRLVERSVGSPATIDVVPPGTSYGDIPPPTDALARTRPIFDSDGGLLATFSMRHASPESLTAIEARIVEIVTRTAGIAIERAREEQALRARTDRQRLLWEVGAVMLTTDDPDAMLRALFRKIAPHFGLDAFTNYLVAEDGSGLVLHAYEGLSTEDAQRWARIGFDDALCGAVARSGVSMAVSHVQSSDDPRNTLAKGFGIRAHACSPLMSGDRVHGTLSFGTARRDAFDDEELEFFRTISRYVTVAYDRIRFVRALRDADKKKDEFIALLAHELRNPLAPLRNGLQVMRLGAGDPAAVARARAMMDRQLGHMVRLIDDLLDISRISLNKLELRVQRVLLSDVVAHAVETARPVLEAQEHALDVFLPKEPVFLDADLTRLAQVLSNLLTNAAKYTPSRGRITLTAERVQDEAVVRVRDDGIGLAPESLRTIFDMFSQVDRSFDRASGGLGIGLALVKGLVEMHGGTVLAESEGQGFGSTFTVRLPAPADVEPVVVQAEGEEAKAPAPKRRVLVVDDNVDSAESMAMILRMTGNDVQMAHDGVEAVELAERFLPDVILMDIGLPRLDGYGATRRIREAPWGEHVRIIALTGWGQESDRAESRRAGCDAHLVKPVELAALEAALAPTIASP